MNETPSSSYGKDFLRTGNFIAGNWYDTGDGQTEVRDKYNQSLIASIPNASEEQMELAIAGAESAFKVLRKSSAEDRRAALARVLEEFVRHEDNFAMLIAQEAGKPISYARGEVARCQTTLQLAMDQILQFTGETVNVDYGAGLGKTAFTTRVPIGPIAAISPFNFPLNLAMHKIAPALALGCPVVLKPSPYAPLSCLAFARIVEKAAYPKGSLSVLLCDVPVAEKMVRDPRMKMLSFTGSPQVGWMLKSISGKKKVVLELGGNAAVIVDETADLEKAAKTCAIGAFLYSGQICISTQRIYVQKEVFETFSKLLIKETEALKTGDPMDEKVLVGPLIDQIHLNRVSEWVEQAVAAGAKVLTGGKVLDEKHSLYAPTLLSKTKEEMNIVCNEAFGPVAIVEPVDSFESAIQAVNTSNFGLQAGVFTNRIDRMKLAHEELEVAGIMINNVPGFRVDGMPYGGVKDSGLGREGLKYAMEDMTESRLIVY